MDKMKPCIMDGPKVTYYMCSRYQKIDLKMKKEPAESVVLKASNNSTMKSKEKAHIVEESCASMIFQNITDVQKEMIFGNMESIPVKKGEWFIWQDTVGNQLYIVDNGKLEVHIVPDDETDTHSDGENIVHMYNGLREKHPHSSFARNSQSPICPTYLPPQTVL
eukprot:1096820-Ditylum_brightwellii.AAC.1